MRIDRINNSWSNIEPVSEPAKTQAKKKFTEDYMDEADSTQKQIDNEIVREAEDKIKGIPLLQIFADQSLFDYWLKTVDDRYITDLFNPLNVTYMYEDEEIIGAVKSFFNFKQYWTTSSGKQEDYLHYHDHVEALVSAIKQLRMRNLKEYEKRK